MKKMQKKARQDNKEGKEPENDEKKLVVKEEEQSELLLRCNHNLINRFVIVLYRNYLL